MKRILFCTLLVLGIQNSHNEIGGFVSSTIGNKVDNEGKSLDLPEQKKTYDFFSLDHEMLKVPKSSGSLIPTINNQITVLKRKQPFKAKPKFTGLKLSQDALRKKLLKTAQALKTWNEKGNEVSFFEQFELYRVNGFDQKGNIEFTAYYTPVFEVSNTADETYQYPIVKIENTKDTQTKQQSGTTLWTKQQNASSTIRMQGSGFIKHKNGKQECLSYLPNMIGNAPLPKGYKGTTQNVFVSFPDFPKGSTGVSLTPNHSIAVDPRYIPYGSCLLAAVPIIDANGKFIRHEYQLVFAQDTGSFVKGMHVDFYCGIGDKAQRKAQFMKHFGKMWLIMVK